MRVALLLFINRKPYTRLAHAFTGTTSGPWRTRSGLPSGQQALQSRCVVCELCLCVYQTDQLLACPTLLQLQILQHVQHKARRRGVSVQLHTPTRGGEQLNCKPTSDEA